MENAFIKIIQSLCEIASKGSYLCFELNNHEDVGSNPTKFWCFLFYLPEYRKNFFTFSSNLLDMFLKLQAKMRNIQRRELNAPRRQGWPYPPPPASSPPPPHTPIHNYLELKLKLDSRVQNEAALMGHLLHTLWMLVKFSAIIGISLFLGDISLSKSFLVEHLIFLYNWA